MPNQTIPITLTWNPVASNVTAQTLNEFGTLVANALSGAIRADITFIPQVVVDPATFQGNLIFNIVQNVFKSWNYGTGSYQAVTQYAIGDSKTSFVGVDTVATGWVLLNGRLISAVPGLTAQQVSNLETLFGAGGTLPTVSPSNISGLPANGSFSGIVWPSTINPDVTPVAGTFTSLSFSNPVTDTEAETFADDTETLRTSVQDSFDVTKQIQAVNEAVLEALNNNTNPPMYVLCFCGYP